MSIPPGANYHWHGLAFAVLVFLLGVLATLAIGNLSGTTVVFAKGGEPVVTLSTMVAMLLSGSCSRWNC